MTKLLVGTSNRLLVCEDGKIRTVLEGSGLYTGISWDDRQVYIAERCHHGAEECEEERIGIYTPGFQKIGEIGRPALQLHDVHDIYYNPPEENLYITNTGKDQICLWNRGCVGSEHATGVLRWEALVGGREWIRRHDTDHVNSLWWHGDTLYVVAHRRGPSQIHTFYETYCLKSTIDLGVEAHNVVVIGGLLVTCSSRDNELLMYTIPRREVVARIKFPGKHYPRGLAASDTHFWVGLTAFEPERGIRNDGPAHIVAVNRKTLRTDHTYNIEDVGQIISLRLMQGTDLAHNGLEFPKEEEA